MRRFINILGAKTAQYCALTRLYMAILLGLCALCGYLITKDGITSDYSNKILLFIGQALIAAGGFVWNDILDRKRDYGVACKPLGIGTVGMSEALILAFFLTGVGLALSIGYSFAHMIIASVQLTFVLIYSWIKARSGLVANLTTAGLCASAFVYGGYGNLHSPNLWAPCILTVIMILAREIVKDIVDMEQDGLAGIGTIPLKYGITKSSIVVSILVVITVLTSFMPFISSAFGGLYFLIMPFVNSALLLSVGILACKRNIQGAQQFLHCSAISFCFFLIAIWK